MLQLRAILPSGYESDGDLIDEGTDTMMVLQALLERYGFKNFQVVRLDKDS